MFRDLIITFWTGGATFKLKPIDHTLTKHVICESDFLFPRISSYSTESSQVGEEGVQSDWGVCVNLLIKRFI